MLSPRFFLVLVCCVTFIFGIALWQKLPFPHLKIITHVVRQHSVLLVEDPLQETTKGTPAQKAFGFSTFAHLPPLDCFSSSVEMEYDIAITGAPFDTATTLRPGARFGPRGVRSASQQMAASWSYEVQAGYSALDNWATIVDCGDVSMSLLDNYVALSQLEQAHKIVSSRPSRNQTMSEFPRILTIGGDHTISLAALRNARSRWGRLSVIHVDAHLDTTTPLIGKGNVSDYAAINHGSFLYFAHKEGLLLQDTSIHVGHRSALTSPDFYLANDRDCGFEIIPTDDIETEGIHGMTKRVRDRVGKTRVYVTVDIDVLDPTFAPGTGFPEPGGWTSRELFTFLRGLEGLEIVGADVVEVAPAYDSRGDTTALHAMEVCRRLLGLFVRSEVTSS